MKKTAPRSASTSRIAGSNENAASSALFSPSRESREPRGCRRLRLRIRRSGRTSLVQSGNAWTERCGRPSGCSSAAPSTPISCIRSSNETARPSRSTSMRASLFKSSTCRPRRIRSPRLTAAAKPRLRSRAITWTPSGDAFARATLSSADPLSTTITSMRSSRSASRARSTAPRHASSRSARS